MKCIGKYKKRVQLKGETIKDRALFDGMQQFERHIKSSPTAYKVHVSNPNTDYTVSENCELLDCFITNVALNDQKNFDEKFIHFRNWVIFFFI